MNELRFETIWFDQRKYEEAESLCYKSGPCRAKQEAQSSSIVDQIAKARETIHETLKGETTTPAAVASNVDQRLDNLEKENKNLKQAIKNINDSLSKLIQRVNQVEISKGKTQSSVAVEQKAKDDDSDSDIDLFGSDDDDEDIKPKPVAQQTKQVKPPKVVIAKSNIILDVKPWDDETDMAVLEEKVRTVACDGLLWGKSKLVPVGYGIKKLQISCVVEDEKCGTDFLEEEICKFEDYVQSMDIAAFNKV